MLCNIFLYFIIYYLIGLLMKSIGFNVKFYKLLRIKILENVKISGVTKFFYFFIFRFRCYMFILNLVKIINLVVLCVNVILNG